MPLFSVIIPTFNRVHLCRAAVESVLRQELQDFELIVVDDGSTDGTSEALIQFGDRLRLLRQENQGQSIARNAAIRAAKGDYIAFLDSDDQWFPWTLATLHRAIKEGGKPAVLAGRNVPFWQQPPEPESLPRSFEIVRFDDVLDFYGRRDPVIFETGVLVIRTDALRAVGGFPLTRHNSEDIDLCLRLGTARGFVRLESPPLFAKLGHSNSTGLQLDLSASGLKDIYARERAGAYPGGATQKRARLALIAVSSRKTISHAARDGRIGLAWSLYRQCCFWNLRLGRWKFVFGLPPAALVGFLRTRAASVRSSPRSARPQ
jgi:cellulose synthase/poly-beta-1,6-N-acetylglucosamine synthase-like glycosyltransferase